ncbi:MAG: hypothetical protein ACFFG0_41275 [Candidatus Thorarchaeota archaeon]
MIKETYEERIKRLNVTKNNKRRIELIAILDNVLGKMIHISNTIASDIKLSDFKYNKDKELYQKIRKNEADFRLNMVKLQRRLYIPSKGTIDE